MKIILLRHGECIGNTGRFDWSQEKYNFLTLRGQMQAQLASHEIHAIAPTFDIAMSSDMLRAQQTLYTVLQSNDKHDQHDCISEPLLNEWWDNPMGKSDAEFRAQIEEFFQTVMLPMWNQKGNALIVSHGYTMRVLIERIRLHKGIISEDEVAASIHRIPVHTPNAWPFVFNTEDKQDLIKITPGKHSTYHQGK